jgi:TRAP-type C4-dicarboxylate transport system permease small subunit
MLRRISAIIQLVENAAVSVLLGVICLVTAIQVLCRFVLMSPLAWSDELAIFAFIWFTLLGSAIGVREKAHIGVDALMRVLPTPSRNLIGLLGLIIVQIFILSLFAFGTELLVRIGDQRSSGLEIRIFWVYLSLPVSTGLMFLHALPEVRRLFSIVKADAPKHTRG